MEPEEMDGYWAGFYSNVEGYPQIPSYTMGFLLGVIAKLESRVEELEKRNLINLF